MKKEQFEEQVSEWDAETVGTAPNSYQCFIFNTAGGTDEANVKVKEAFTKARVGFGTQFGAGHKSLLVRSDDTRAAIIAEVVLGKKPTFTTSLSR